MYKDYQFTKIVALRVEKAINNTQLEESQQAVEDVSVSIDFDDKMKHIESVLKKVFGKKNVVPRRSQSLGK